MRWGRNLDESHITDSMYATYTIHDTPGGGPEIVIVIETEGARGDGQTKQAAGGERHDERRRVRGVEECMRMRV